MESQRPPRTPAWFRALRPRHWIKNTVLLAGILFTLDEAHPASHWLMVLGGILVFSALASAIYLVNDICDAEQDRLHPRKRLRPIASGELSPKAAKILATGLALGAVGAAAALGWEFLGISLAYLFLTIAYSVWLKHVVIVDVLALSACYVLRAAAGAAVIGVLISPWLLVCTTLGALLIGLAKRRNELLVLDRAGDHRKILQEYTPAMLDQFIGIVTSTTLTAYMLYTFFSRTGQERPLMMLTIPFVLYGLLRFLYLSHQRGKGGNPVMELVEDRPLLVNGLLWVATVVGVMLLTGGHPR